MTRRALEWINYGVNYLIPFNEHERDKIANRDSWRNSFVLPRDERVTMPSLWTVELFPPSQSPSLEDAIRRNGWDRRRRITYREANQEMLLKSRGGSGWSWWRLAEIMDTASNSWYPDGSRERLPDYFRAVELRAIQIGSGLTAVVAHFSLHDEGAARLDSVWRAEHEPILLRRRGARPQSLGHKFAAFHNTQTARREVHDAARGWMKERVPGFFASSSEPHTLVDMLLTEKFDPLETGEPPREHGDAFRALGLGEYYIYQYVSPDIPKFRLMPTHSSLAPAIPAAERTWGLWAQKQAAVDAAGDQLSTYGSEPSGALARHYSEAIESFILTLAMSDFLQAAEVQYSQVRDRARIRHSRFRTRAIKSLRRTLLTLSLDIASAYRDIQIHWNRRAKFQGEAEFTLEATIAEREHRDSEGLKPLEPEHVNLVLRERQRESLERLVAADHDYRDILSTVASLGASADASKLGRIALWVALASLVVAALTLLLSETQNRSLIDSTLLLLG